MIEFLLQPIFLKVIVSLILGGLVMIYYLLYCEFSKSKLIQEKRIRELENLVHNEMNRSERIFKTNLTLSQLNEKASEKLELAKYGKRA